MPTIKADKDGIRFATPKVVAEYRAKRLKCKTIADISCGIGGQALYFAKYCDLVYAIEIDEKKIAYAKMNANAMGLNNINFIRGDALSPHVITQLPKLDIVFSDPARPPTEIKRSIHSLSPSISKVMEAYSEKTSDFAFEVPPQLTSERIPFDCEKEYISLQGKLNRLNLYFNSLKRADVSAVALPGEASILSDEKTRSTKKMELPSSYAYEPHECVTKAGLVEQLLSDLKQQDDDTGILELDGKRTIISSSKPLISCLFKNSYKVTGIMEADLKKINKYLKGNSFGKLIIRAPIEPEKYWKVRNLLEEGLSGERKAHLFLKDKKAIVCEVLSN